MNPYNFLDDNYGAEQCVAASNTTYRWTVSFLLVGLLALLLIKKTGADLEQTRKDYLGLTDENVD
jgi:hypothetical protein